MCLIVKNKSLDDNNTQSFKIRILSSTTEFIVPDTSIVPLGDPEPSKAMNCPDMINKGHITEVMTQEKIKRLWETLDCNFTDEERLFVYWHKILNHAP